MDTDRPDLSDGQLCAEIAFNSGVLTALLDIAVKRGISPGEDLRNILGMLDRQALRLLWGE